MGLSLIVMIVGNVWYAISSDIFQLLLSRFVVGIAAANYAPASAYLSYATSPSERSRIMAWNSASTVLGFICGPSFSLVTAMPFLQFTIQFGMYELEFNEYTAPGWISAFFALIGLIFLIPFREVKILKTGDKRVDILNRPSMRSIQSFSRISKTSIPTQGVVACLFLCFCFTSAFTIFETTGPLYTKMDPYLKFGVLENSIMFLAISGVSLTSLLILQALLFLINDFALMIVFSFLLTGGILVLFDWVSGYITLLRLSIGIAFVSAGYSSGQSLLSSIFSKLLDKNEQGMMMGWLSSSGSIARMVCPPIASYVFEFAGANYLFVGTSALVLIGIIVMLAMNRYIVKANPSKSGQ